MPKPTKPTKPTQTSTYSKVFEDGDFYITLDVNAGLILKRNSTIIHECPKPPDGWKLTDEDLPWNILITMPNGDSGECYYCSQEPSDALITVYKLHNWDHFANDAHASYNPNLRMTNNRKFRSRIM